MIVNGKEADRRAVMKAAYVAGADYALDAATYKPSEKYYYPELKENNRPVLKRQKYDFY